MTAHIFAHGLSYFSVPKCACTSMKMMFFEFQNGFEFRNFTTSGNHYHIHRFYPSVPFAEGRRAAERNPYRISVIRSPVERMESCFRHWVASPNGRQTMKASASDLIAKGVPAAPNWQEFVDNLGVYRAVLPNIAHHTEKLSYFLGTDPSYFEMIYPMSRIGEAVEAISNRTGKHLEIRHYNETKSTQEFQGADAASKDKINSMFAEDLELFGRFLQA